MLIQGLIADFKQNQIFYTSFKVCPYEDVMAFIELSVQLSIHEITVLRLGKPLSDPEVFYVPK